MINITLYFIGLGLNDEKDVTLKGYDIIKKSDEIYLDSYTSRMINTTPEKLSKFYGKVIKPLTRYELENKANEIIVKPALNKNVALLVIGDVFSATTHISIYLSAKKNKVDVRIINNASIINAVGITGLQIYKFGKITSVSYPVCQDYSIFKKINRVEELPDNLNYDTTPYEVLKDNLSLGYHTLFLLDLKINEPTLDELKRSVFKTNHPSQIFMTIREALLLLLKIETIEKKKIVSKETRCIGVARIGSRDAVIKYGKIGEIMEYDFGAPLHSLIIPGKLHFLEEEVLKLYEL